MKTGRARTQERILRGAPARPGPFAGLSLAYEFFVERVRPVDPAALDRWKALESEGWDVTALVDAQATTMVGLGFRYARSEAA